MNATEDEVANDSTIHALAVGDRAHRIVGMALRGNLIPDRSARALLLMRCGRDVFGRHPITYRQRESFLDAVTAAGVYLNRFHPSDSWKLEARKFTHGPCRFDLVYRNAKGEVLIDELKLGIGRRGEVLVAEQIKRYLDAGRQLWADRFVGVRLCAVHEPLQSRMYLPNRGRSILLSATQVEGLAVR